MNRVLPGLAMAAAWVVLILFGGATLFWLVVAGLSLLLLHEYFRMTSTFLLDRGSMAVIIGISMLPVLAAHVGRLDLVAAGTTGAVFALILFCLRRFANLADPFGFLGISGFGLLYISYAMGHLVLLRSHEQGIAWMLVLSAITAGSDTGAYYCGRSFGRRKLCPSISPKKTVAGAVGGVVIGVLASVVMARLMSITSNLAVLVLTTALLVGVGIVGDLAESVIKRSVGVKDSSTLLGGHGGLLDRMDSLLLTGPVLFYLVHFGLL